MTKLVFSGLTALVLVALGWFGRDRYLGASALEWKDSVAVRDQRIAARDLRIAVQAAEVAQLLSRNMRLEAERPILPPIRRQRPRPTIAPGTASDTVAQLTTRLAAAEDDLDTLRNDLATVRLDHGILVQQMATLDSILAIKDSTIAAQDTTIADLRASVQAAPVDQRRCRLPLIRLPCPTIVAGYGWQVREEPDGTGRDRYVAQRGVQLTVGWDMLSLAGIH